MPGRRKNECRQCGLPQVVSSDHSVYCAWHPDNRKKKEKVVAKKVTKKPETDNNHKPWVSNYPPLKDWLDKHDARCMWQVPSQPQPRDAESDWHPTFYTECWIVNRHPVILVVRSDKMGWDIYTAADTPRVDETLLDAERRIGLAE